MSSARDRRHRINPTTHALSVELRQDATHPEQVLWYSLRNKQLKGVKFRRQHPIGVYIVDFASLRPKIAIELDGESHEGRQAYDEERQRTIEAEGFRVVRFTNDDVLSNLDGVLEIIYAAVKGNASPSPNPSLAGRGIKPR